MGGMGKEITLQTPSEHERRGVPGVGTDSYDPIERTILEETATLQPTGDPVLGAGKCALKGDVAHGEPTHVPGAWQVLWPAGDPGAVCS